MTAEVRNQNAYILSFIYGREILVLQKEDKQRMGTSNISEIHAKKASDRQN
jgi:hypothetical protein